ncbi:electron transfer flavoprotein subunit beta [Pontiella sp.]|uniref:electron transfer flavoprotein subunit beta/FixA family protein n=1 Tax=Pontiella sp. TaxID=2837462 RepID=UPI003566E4EB
MNIVVCIKQVPDSDKVTIDRETNRLNRAGVPSIINPFDENALEMALQLKELHGGKVTVISMGPPQAEEALRTALSHGADEAVLISDRKFGGADTWATSYTISLAIKKLEGVDLVLFGKQAIDGDTAQVGPGVAHFLDIPMLTYAKAVEVTGETFKVNKVTEDGYEIWDVDKPCALTVVKEANNLRMPSLKKKMAAKKAVIPCWGVEELQPDEDKIGLAGSPTKVSKVFAPPVKLNKEILSGEPSEMITELIGKLKGQHVL